MIRNYEPLAWTLGIVGGIGFIYSYAMYGDKQEVELQKVKNNYHELIVQDLNADGIPEKFYEINGHKVFLEIDGKNLESTLKR